MTLEKVRNIAIENAGFDELWLGEAFLQVVFVDYRESKSLERASSRSSACYPECKAQLVSKPAGVGSRGCKHQQTIRWHTCAVQSNHALEQRRRFATARSTENQSTLGHRRVQQGVGR